MRNNEEIEIENENDALNILKESEEFKNMIPKEIIQYHKNQPCVEIRKNENGNYSFGVTVFADSVEEATETAKETINNLNDYYNIK